MTLKNMTVFRRGLVVWLVIIFAEFLHGTARTLFLQPLVGDFRARQIAVFTGILIILAVSYGFADWLRAATYRQLFLVGGLWVGLTLIFEIALGRLLNLSWERILSDYDISNGGLMPLGLLFLTFAPLIARALKDRFSVRAKLSDTKSR